jgi:hypothetical protein
MDVQLRGDGFIEVLAHMPPGRAAEETEDAKHNNSISLATYNQNLAYRAGIVRRTPHDAAHAPAPHFHRDPRV